MRPLSRLAAHGAPEAIFRGAPKSFISTVSSGVIDRIIANSVRVKDTILQQYLEHQRVSFKLLPHPVTEAS
jgi:hypothetical protein